MKPLLFEFYTNFSSEKKEEMNIIYNLKTLYISV